MIIQETGYPPGHNVSLRHEQQGSNTIYFCVCECGHKSLRFSRLLLAYKDIQENHIKVINAAMKNDSHKSWQNVLNHLSNHPEGGIIK